MKGKKQIGSITSAECGQLRTAEICMSAAGQFLPPHLIFPRKRMKLELLEGTPPGTIYECHASGWMQQEVFTKWFHHYLLHTASSVDNHFRNYLPMLVIMKICFVQVEIYEDFLRSCINRLKVLFDSVCISLCETTNRVDLHQKTQRMILILTAMGAFINDCNEAYAEERAVLALSRLPETCLPGVVSISFNCLGVLVNQYVPVIRNLWTDTSVQQSLDNASPLQQSSSDNAPPVQTLQPLLNQRMSPSRNASVWLKLEACRIDYNYCLV